jgi:N-carbamoylputrescine amidase
VAIADGDGTIIAELGDEEAVIVGDVTLDPARKIHALGKEHLRYGRWIAPVPLEFKLYRLVEAMGARSYRTNPRRRTKALLLSGGKSLGA